MAGSLNVCHRQRAREACGPIASRREQAISRAGCYNVVWAGELDGLCELGGRARQHARKVAAAAGD